MDDELLRFLEKEIDCRDQDFRKINKQIYENPEVQFQEVRAHRFLTEWLRGEGWDVTPHAFNLATAFKAEYRKGNGRSVSFNAEYDALPGIGHACGHNLICTASVAAAASVKRAMEKGFLTGRVVLFGTPAEEGGGGKIQMMENGAFKDVEISMMVHPMRNGLAAGASTLANYRMVVEYHGVSSHAAASPHEAKNSLDAFVLAYTNISALRQQLLPSDRIHGIITHGGQAPNIIPDYTRSEWSFRATTRQGLETLKTKVIACFEAAALATGTELKITWTSNYLNMVSNKTLASVFADMANKRHSLPIPSVYEDKMEFPGSTDQGNVSWMLPSIHPWYPIGGEHNNHNAGFTEQAGKDSAYEATIKQAKLLASTAAFYMLDDALAKKVREEFEAST